jgi:diacylglycerol kinase (ATP)
MHKATGLKRVVRAFVYSLEGIGSTLKHEEAFRQELALAAILVPASFLLGVPAVENVALIASVFLVLIVELLNSAVEAVVDDVSLNNRPLAKRAKDMGSAAVFMSLLNCAIVWAVIIVSNWREILS